jgi:hypothetical protein
MATLRLCILWIVALAGCVSTVTTLDGRSLPLSSPEFRDYVSQVFRDQNEVASSLALAQDDARGERLDALISLEDELLFACFEVNALAIANRDNLRLGARRQVTMAATAPGCEAVTGQVRGRLQTL